MSVKVARNSAISLAIDAAPTAPAGNHPVQVRAGTFLIIAAWFGLFTGLVEGVLFLILQALGQLTWVWTEIVWVAALFNFLLFSALGLSLAGLARLFPRRPVATLAVFLFAFFASLDWLLLVLHQHVHRFAIALLAIGLAAQLTRWFRRHESTFLATWRKGLPPVILVAMLTLLGIEGSTWIWERMAIANLPAAAPGSPNVLVIVIDACRADHLSCYGYSRPTSPTIDRLAREGVVFENSFATASYTLPSHASLLTGLYPYEHGVEWHTPKALIDCPHSTLPEVLQSRGYRTAAFSANTFWFTREQGFGRGFSRFEDFFHSPADMALRTVYGRILETTVLRWLGFEDVPARKSADDVNRSVRRWLDAGRGQPFFAFINFFDVHDPYLPPEPFRSKFSQGAEQPGGTLNWRIGRENPAMTDAQLQGEIDAYDGAIAYVDDRIKKLLDALRERALDENTLIVLTSDHGEAFGEHGVYLHGNSLYLEEIKVPLVCWCPGQIPASKRVSHPVTNAAVPATIFDLLFHGEKSAFPGTPLRRLWEGNEAFDGVPPPLSELARKPWRDERCPCCPGSARSLIGLQLHFIEHEKLGVALFDWRNDPRESHDLSGTVGKGWHDDFRSRLRELE